MYYSLSLQDDYVKLQKDLKSALETLRDVRGNHANILKKADKIIAEKDAAIKELRIKVMYSTPMLKHQICFIDISLSKQVAVSSKVRKYPKWYPSCYKMCQ